MTQPSMLRQLSSNRTRIVGFDYAYRETQEANDALEG